MGKLENDEINNNSRSKKSDEASRVKAVEDIEEGGTDMGRSVEEAEDGGPSKPVEDDVVDGSPSKLVEEDVVDGTAVPV